MLETGGTHLSFGDFLCAAFGGVQPFDSTMNSKFNLPTGWLCVCVCAIYVMLDYPLRDLKGVGTNLLIRTGSRRLWWAGVCLWICACSVLLWLCTLGICALWTIADGGSFSLGISERVPESLSFKHLLLTLENPVVPSSIFIIIPLALIAFGLLQTVCAMYLKPLFSFVVVLAVLFFSAFYDASPWLLGGCLMICRFDTVTAGGMSPLIALVFVLFCICTLVVGGYYTFKNYDIKGDPS
ncbi:MAG: hypothetical protein IKE43_11710 [Coriobacteriales bacterium]|nr:hypothetical protein [Coriobacteriales bacterium]